MYEKCREYCIVRTTSLTRVVHTSTLHKHRHATLTWIRVVGVILAMENGSSPMERGPSGDVGLIPRSIYQSNIETVLVIDQGGTGREMAYVGLYVFGGTYL